MARQIDADALMNEIASFYPMDVGGSAMQAAVMAKVAAAPTVNGWISVKDRLPEDSRFVLVCNDDGHMMVAQYIGEDHIWEWQYKYTNYDVDVWDDQEQGPVCWWMPLPEPPEEGEHETETLS